MALDFFFKKGTLNSFLGKKGGLNNRIKVHWRNKISHHFNNSKRNIDRAHWFWHGRIRLHLRWRNYLLASFQKSQKRVKKGKMALCNSDMFIIKRIHHIWLVMCQIQSQHLCHIFNIGFSAASWFTFVRVKKRALMHNKVQTFWETHKIWKNLPIILTNLLIYLVYVKTMWKIFSNYVCFSKSPNFNTRYNFSLKLSHFFKLLDVSKRLGLIHYFENIIGQALHS